VFRVITEPSRLRGLTGDGNEFVYVYAPVHDPAISLKLQHSLDVCLIRSDGSRAPCIYVNLDALSGVGL
jgi:hypothetical protein